MLALSPPESARYLIKQTAFPDRALSTLSRNSCRVVRKSRRTGSADAILQSGRMSPVVGVEGEGRIDNIRAILKVTLYVATRRKSRPSRTQFPRYTKTKRGMLRPCISRVSLNREMNPLMQSTVSKASVPSPDEDGQR